MNKWIVLAALVAMGGCASGGTSNTDNAVAEADGETEQVCRRVKKVGTNFTRTVCKTRREMSLERDQAEQAIRQQRQRQATGGTISSGG